MNDSTSFKGKKNNILLISVIVIAIVLISSGTYAFFDSIMEINKPGHIVQSKCFRTQYNSLNDDGTQDLNGNLFPSNNPHDGVISTIQMAIDGTCGVYASGNLYLQINEGDNVDTLVKTVTPHCENPTTLETLSTYTTSDDCIDNDGVWVTDGTALKYALYFNDEANPLSVGYIDTYDEELNIYSDFNIPFMDISKDSLSDFSYNILIWLDSNLIDSSYSLIAFSGYTYGTFTQLEGDLSDNSPHAPVLDPGMIPVTIASNGTVKTISPTDSAWYDYDGKKWANVVLVDDSTRNDYLNTSGVTVSQGDILAYYVWIPRFKYKLFPMPQATEDTGFEELIDIVFEKKWTKKSSGSTIGSYYTHPAFTFGDVELSGIWVGKFETMGDDEEYPLVLPYYEQDLVQNLSSQFVSSLRFSGGEINEDGTVSFSGNNYYGLTSSTDSHMMKNSEWGAVAYLSHSKYGFGNGQMAYNSYFITGYGPTSSLYYANSWTQPSTNGNITGIYDMSGGYAEAVMANYGGYSGGNEETSSGFNGPTGDGGPVEDSIPFPESKYYDFYSEDDFPSVGKTDYYLCTLETCGGHALHETLAWYGGYSQFFSSAGSVWMARGYYQTAVVLGIANSTSGIFSFSSYNGSGYESGEDSMTYSYRSVLIPNMY